MDEDVECVVRVELAPSEGLSVVASFNCVAASVHVQKGHERLDYRKCMPFDKCMFINNCFCLPFATVS